MPNKYLDSVQLGRLITKIKTYVNTAVTGYLPTTGGSITGNLTVSGTITGDVTGDVTGNADTATSAMNDGNGNEISTNYLPLSGGTMTGSISSSTTNMLVGAADDQLYRIVGATSASNGAHLVLTGNNYTANPGSFTLRVNNASTDIRLVGKLDGTLQWNSKEIERVDTIDANYIRFESGLQIYWGAESGVTSSGTQVTFTAPFVSAPRITLGTTGSAHVYCGQVSATGVLLRSTASAGSTVIYTAVGYWK